jgi:hypothetical protein
MIALIIVSGLLVLSFMTYSDSIKISSEAKKLKGLLNQVAAKCTEMISLATITNGSSESYVQMPASIGTSQYWLGLYNDSSAAWLEGGLGTNVIERTYMRVYLLSHTSASGVFVSSYGAVRIECQLENRTPHILLTNSSIGA